MVVVEFRQGRQVVQDARIRWRDSFSHRDQLLVYKFNSKVQLHCLLYLGLSDIIFALK